MPRLYVTGVTAEEILWQIYTLSPKPITKTIKTKKINRGKKSSNSTNTLTAMLNKYAKLLRKLPSAVLLGFLLHSVSTATAGLVRITAVKNKTCEIGHTVSLNNKLSSAWFEQH